MLTKWKIKKGDTVIVTTGKDKGKTGEVISVLKDDNKVYVKGIKIVKRHKKPSMSNPGGVTESESPIHISNIMHLDPIDKKGVRIGFKILENGQKIRYSKRSGAHLDQ